MRQRHSYYYRQCWHCEVALLLATVVNRWALHGFGQSTWSSSWPACLTSLWKLIPPCGEVLTQDNADITTWKLQLGLVYNLLTLHSHSSVFMGKDCCIIIIIITSSCATLVSIGTVFSSYSVHWNSLAAMVVAENLSSSAFRAIPTHLRRPGQCCFLTHCF